MQKIIINKNDDPALVVEKILEEKSKDIVLVIPKFSQVADSVSNFHLIKREADADGKNLLIESVDDDALALAQAAKLAGINPFLSNRRKGMSDIIAPNNTVMASSKTKYEEDDYESDEIDENITSSQDSEVDFAPPVHRSPRKLKMVSILIALVVVVPAAYFASSSVIPAVTVNLQTKQYDWQWEEAINADANLALADSSRDSIPAEIFTEKKNITLEATASGAKKVEHKATGTVTIFNAYSSKDQPLVATTRLLTPDGKLFRLVEAVTVPGADIEAGEVIPSSIVAKVIADKAGELYNIGPVSRFSIPGFQGSSKYKGFYAESTGDMTGGFIGTVAFATDEDVEAAEAKLTSTLEEHLTALSFANLPANFISPAEANEFSITNIEVNQEADGATGKFSIFGEAELKVMALPKDEILAIIKQEAEAEFGFLINIQDYDLKLNDIIVDLEAGKINFTPSFSGTLSRSLDSNELAASISGLSSINLKDYVVSMAGIEGAKISFWPFWVDKAPSNSSRIKVKINE